MSERWWGSASCWWPHHAGTRFPPRADPPRPNCTWRAQQGERTGAAGDGRVVAAVAARGDEAGACSAGRVDVDRWVSASERDARSFSVLQRQ